MVQPNRGIDDRQAEPLWRRKFRPLRDLGAAVTTWVNPPPPDAWSTQYPPHAATEQRPYLDFKIGIFSTLSDIEFFILPDSRSRRWANLVKRLEEFCEGAENYFENFRNPAPAVIQTQGTQHKHETKAWVSGQNISKYPNKGLSPIELHEILQKKHAPDNYETRAVISHPRRIYINHPDGPCVSSLIKAATHFQVQGFRELFVNYINRAPEPHISIKDSDFWSGSFIMLANIPYFAVSDTNREDTRTFAGKDKLRHRYDFSFLNPTNSTEENFDGGPFLYEPVCSLMVTGKSDVNWTAVCLNEDSFADAQRLDTYDDVDMAGLNPGDDIDPIIQKPKLEEISPPRTYFLQAVASFFVTVFEDQEDIKDRFRASLDHHSPTPPKDSEYYLNLDQTKKWTNKALELLPKILTMISQQRETLEEFLTDEVKFGEDEIPKGRLYQSLGTDKLAIKSLKRLRTTLKGLKDVERGIERSKKQFEEIRLERQHENGDAQRDLGQSVRMLTVSTIFLAILALLAQLFGNAPYFRYLLLGLAIIAGVISFCYLVVLLEWRFSSFRRKWHSMWQREGSG